MSLPNIIKFAFNSIDSALCSIKTDFGVFEFFPSYSVDLLLFYTLNDKYM